jgi:ureidoacrylate peracid hydrolase
MTDVGAAPETGVGFDPRRTALLVIDPVNDFLSEGGAAWEMTKSTVKKNDVVAQLRRLVDGAREAGVPVLFGPMAYTEEDYADEDLQRRSGINRLMFETKMFLAGSWGADFHPEVQPADGDVILEPHKGTDVFETDLRQHLERLGTRQLVIAGMTANLCCESTGRHATEHGYQVTFLSDAIGAENLPAYEASIHVNYPLIANAVMEVDEFLDAVRAPESQQPQVGDTVVGSDRGKIGEVQEVAAAGDAPGYLRVPRGVVLEKDTYIPLDAVTHRSSGRVYVNIPKLVVGKMPWGEPPTSQSQTDKRGPAASEVPRLYRSHHPTGVPG